MHIKNYSSNFKSLETISHATGHGGHITEAEYNDMKKSGDIDSIIHQPHTSFNDFDINHDGIISNADLSLNNKSGSSTHSSTHSSKNNQPTQHNSSGSSSSPGANHHPNPTGRSGPSQTAKTGDYHSIPGNPNGTMNYVALPSNARTTIKTGGAQYMLIHSSGDGHSAHHTDGVNRDHFHLPGNCKVVGWVGANDASMMLVKLDGSGTFKFQGQNECGYSLIRTHSVPTIENAAKDGKNTGYMDPDVGKKQVGSRPGCTTIYKEDEGAHEIRIKRLTEAGGVYYGKGEDNALVVTTNDIKLSGNGAVMFIRWN